ncbi:energy-coupling factor ABC transporter ATP-binding protein [Clostridium luticellarii]|uniref:ABC transporter ATP-binding protein n=1 Tax=Clostridium luticellarii TaxID=1691940 RepID=A0A2T0BES8_9CLOT|nr:ATP-binding cassette domain-containing protein [Clostridium luticellarii]MCI1944838.1 ATP-binding cassette domain-containing protein [Clostridium luticellarii]MCI1968346.1 ATP-binding cassette domain-containing protein [Clostridium luticellarii]MCI1995344.1 ATP-binding cassette domain-containing protein [Clostridium luticellarii]MCI2039394.1 ATP-binding cassette domain-containing protein [Clostridium luticellarii]PRR82368.1 Energy-coupling factor transporter ATP-binding protein EcfA3 [Clost
MALIEVNKVSYAYSDGSLALENVNMKIEEGEKVAILGPNGAGKSTLFHLFNGISKPKSGTITIDGLQVCKKNLVKIRQMVGMVFQDSDDQLFNSTVRQEIAYGLLNMGMSGKELEDTIAWALKVVGMTGYDDKSPHNLSGGQKKRIALASVLAMKPKVMVLDEPTAALDPRGVHKLIELLDMINKKLGITLIFATHDVDTVPLLADTVYLLDKGSIVTGGTIEEVFNQKELIRKIDLRLPRVAHLVEILKKDGAVNVDHLPLTIGQAKYVLENKNLYKKI